MCCARETLILKKATLTLSLVSTVGTTHLILFNTDFTWGVYMNIKVGLTQMFNISGINKYQ